MNSASTSELTVGSRPEAHSEAAENDSAYFGPTAIVPWHVHWTLNESMNVVCPREYNIAASQWGPRNWSSRESSDCKKPLLEPFGVLG